MSPYQRCCYDDDDDDDDVWSAAIKVIWQHVCLCYWLNFPFAAVIRFGEEISNIVHRQNQQDFTFGFFLSICSNKLLANEIYCPI